MPKSGKARKPSAQPEKRSGAVAASAPRKQGSSKSMLWLAVTVVAGALLAYAATLPEPQGSPTAVKKFTNFEDFYPFYLKEHSDVTCRRLHLAGTAAAGLVALVYPGVIPAALAGGAVGRIMFNQFFDVEHGFFEMAAMVGTFIVLSFVATRRMLPALLVLGIGYGFAWVGHFFFEHNQPATFVYPTFSLLGDYRMAFELVTGRHGPL